MELLWVAGTPRLVVPPPWDGVVLVDRVEGRNENGLFCPASSPVMTLSGDLEAAIRLPNSGREEPTVPPVDERAADMLGEGCPGMEGAGVTEGEADLARAWAITEADGGASGVGEEKNPGPGIGFCS